MSNRKKSVNPTFGTRVAPNKQLDPTMPTFTTEQAREEIVALPKTFLQRLLEGIGSAAKGAWDYYRQDNPGLQRFLGDVAIAAAGPHQEIFGAQLGRAAKGYAAGRQAEALMTGKPLTGFNRYGLTPEELQAVRGAKLQEQEMALRGREVATGERRAGVEEKLAGIQETALPVEMKYKGAVAGAQMPWEQEYALKKYLGETAAGAAGARTGSDRQIIVTDMNGNNMAVTFDKTTGAPINIVPLGTPVGAKITEPERQNAIEALTRSIYTDAGFGGHGAFSKSWFGAGPNTPEEMVELVENGKLAARLDSLVKAETMTKEKADLIFSNALRLDQLMKRTTTSYPPLVNVPLTSSEATAKPEKKKETGIGDLLGK
jgi:hypothetical protein